MMGDGETTMDVKELTQLRFEEENKIGSAIANAISRLISHGASVRAVSVDIERGFVTNGESPIIGIAVHIDCGI